MTSNRSFFLSLVCLGFLLQNTSILTAQSYYFARDTGDLNASAGIWSYHFNVGKTTTEGPEAAQVAITTSEKYGIGYPNVTLSSTGSAALNPDDQSTVSISGLSECGISHVDPEYELMEDSEAYNRISGSATWTFESEVYEEGEGSPHVDGTIDASWQHAGVYDNLTGGAWNVKWNGGTVITVIVEVQLGEYEVHDENGYIIDYGYVDPTDSISIPFVIDNPDVGDTLEINFVGACDIFMDPFGVDGGGDISWTVTLEETDL